MNIMTSPKDEFIDFISRIVHEHMDEDQQTQFDIDGKEMIESIFQPTHAKIGGPDKTAPAFGVSQASLEILNAATGFGALVISCLTLYIEIKKKKKKSLKDRMHKLEFLAALKEKLVEHKMPPELIDTIHNKYADELTEILDRL